MAEVKWIKIMTDIFDNRKIKQIEKLPDADAIIIIWFKILCLAGNLNENGLITLTEDVPYTDEMLANEFNKPINTIRLALEVFQKFKMIEIINDIYCVSNWEKYQNVDGLEKIREQTRKRVAQHRERQKQLTLSESNVTCNVTVTQCNATDKDIDKEIEVDKDINNIYIVEQSTTPPKLSSNCNEIIKYLNQKIGTNYKCTTKKTQTLIRARINEGFIEEDFKKVIDNKCEEWLGTEWEKFLRPETLFGTKFESYLNTKVQKKGESYNGRDKQNNSKYSEIDLSANLAKSTTDEEIDDSGLI